MPETTTTEFEQLRDRVVGHQFPGGTFTVEEYERFLGHEAMKSPPLPAGMLHPVWVLLGALRGMGIDTDALTALADASAHDGTMFGETELELLHPLISGVEYTVRGGVVDIVRKESAKVGRMDLMTFRLELVDPKGTVAAVSLFTYVFPRRSGIHAA